MSPLNLDEVQKRFVESKNFEDPPPPVDTIAGRIVDGPVGRMNDKP
jgi:hypothetical protein